MYSDFYSILSWLLLFIISIASASRILKTKKKSVIGRDKLPLNPPKLPIRCKMHQMGKLHHQELWKLDQKYGRVMLLQLGNIPTLVISWLNKSTEQSFHHEREFEVGRLIDCLSAASPYSVNLDEKMFDLVGGVGAVGKSYKGKGFDGREVEDIPDEDTDMANSCFRRGLLPILWADYRFCNWTPSEGG
ncbi:unnamed protein product [Fraxinus pennsylvanica]|uniref:Uncharacterized protein n=1 Tax=Fraxinus pennsylvanica TaxID=56036 RepID=A0AAD1YW71_9LAMI|nr:unnamed protein product [Fraxinus pennsylvanica]